MKTVNDIIDAAGVTRLYEKIEDLHGKGMLDRKLKDSSAITHWRHNGIPPRYWSAVIACTGVTVDEIYTANEELKEQRARSIARNSGRSRRQKVA